MTFVLSSKAVASVKVGGTRRAARPARGTLVTMNAVQLKPLPYAMDALEPHMSKSTFEFHYGKHHRAYVDNLNKQIAGKEWDSATLDQIVQASWNNGNPTPEFNNAAQVGFLGYFSCTHICILSSEEETHMFSLICHIGLEPHLLLGVHEAQRWWCPYRQAGRRYQARLWFLR